MDCNECGLENVDGAVVCPSCGADLVIPGDDDVSRERLETIIASGRPVSGKALNPGKKAIPLSGAKSAPSRQHNILKKPPSAAIHAETVSQELDREKKTVHAPPPARADLEPDPGDLVRRRPFTKLAAAILLTAAILWFVF